MPCHSEQLMPELHRFHLAMPVHDLAAARSFYGELLGCPEGRSSEHWVDFDLFGHQFVAHLSETATERITNDVDGDAVGSLQSAPSLSRVIDAATETTTATRCVV